MGRWIKKHKGLFIFLCIFTTVVVSIVFLVVQAQKASKMLLDAMTRDETAQIERRDLVEAVSATGTVISCESKSVSAIVSGANVENILVEVGDEVKQGDLICVLDSSKLQRSLEIAQLNLDATTNSLNATLSAANRQYNDAVNSQNYTEAMQGISLADAERNFLTVQTKLNEYGDSYLSAKDRVERLEEIKGLALDDPTQVAENYELIANRVADYNTQYESAITIETFIPELELWKATRDANYEVYIGYANTAYAPAKSAYETAQLSANNAKSVSASAVSAAAAGISSAQNNKNVGTLSAQQQIDELKDQIENCNVYSPINGIVTTVSITNDSTYIAGTPIVMLEDVSNYEVSTEVDEYDINKIKVGQEVVIKTNGTGDVELKGKVKSVAPRATTSMAGLGAGKVTYRVVVSIESPCDELRLDMTAKLSIVINKTENTITVPYESVLTDNDGNKYVQIQTDEVDELGKPKTKDVTVTTGIESDYYVEITGGDIAEGMTVVVPRSGDGAFDIYKILEEQGALSGF